MCTQMLKMQSIMWPHTAWSSTWLLILIHLLFIRDIKLYKCSHCSWHREHAWVGGWAEINSLIRGTFPPIVIIKCFQRPCRTSWHPPWCTVRHGPSSPQHWASRPPIVRIPGLINIACNIVSCMTWDASNIKRVWITAEHFSKNVQILNYVEYTRQV